MEVLYEDVALVYILSVVNNRKHTLGINDNYSN